MISEPPFTLVGALLLTVADGDEPHYGWLAVGADGRIAGVGAGEPTEAEIRGPMVDVGGAIVAPGFVSAHSHLHTSGLRGMAADQTLYGWLGVMTEMHLGCAAEDLYWATLHGSLDFLDHGITSAYNFAHTRVLAVYDPATGSAAPRIRPPEFLTRQFDATADSGIRVATALRIEDDDLGPDAAVAEFEDMLVEVRTRTPADQHLGASVYGGVQWGRTRRRAELEAAAMARHGLVNQAHFVETAQGIEGQRAKFAWYRDAGALGPRMLFGHFVHPTAEMVDAVVGSGSAVVWQPASNGRLGSGIADVVALRERGVRVGMGLDDQSCCDVSDPFQNMRVGLFLQRAQRSDASVLSPREVLRMHTLGSAEVLGVADRVGSLEPGKLADLLVVDPHDPDTGPVWDPWATYVLACGPRNLREVRVGGRLRSANGRSTHPAAARSRVEVADRMTAAARRRGLPVPFARPSADPGVHDLQEQS